MPDISMCHGVIVEGASLKLCSDCARRTATPNDPVQTYMVPTARRAGTFWRCLNRLSPNPAESRDFAPAAVATAVGDSSSN